MFHHFNKKCLLNKSPIFLLSSIAYSCTNHQSLLDAPLNNNHQISQVKVNYNDDDKKTCTSEIIKSISDKKYKTIIIGSGTSGCIVAYLTSKWMVDHNILGEVLLIDRGPGFNPKCGPDPKLKGWFDNWGNFGEAHDTTYKGR
jgi:hypothetical protein